MSKYRKQEYEVMLRLQLAEADKRTADLQAQLEAVRRERECVKGAVRALLTILDEINQYQQQPERGDPDTECACCMGELVTAEDRIKMNQARATLDAAPVVRRGQMHSCDIPGCLSCANPEEPDEAEGGDGE